MRRVVPAVIGCSLLVAACTASDAANAPKTREITSIPTTTEMPSTTAKAGDTLPPSTLSPEPLDYEIVWEDTAGRVDTGRLTVPLDYADPQGETIDLYVARRRADGDRVGIMLVNNGGPGSPASSMALNATAWFGPALIVVRFLAPCKRHVRHW